MENPMPPIIKAIHQHLKQIPRTYQLVPSTAVLYYTTNRGDWGHITHDTSTIYLIQNGTIQLRIPLEDPELFNKIENHLTRSNNPIKHKNPNGNPNRHH